MEEGLRVSSMKKRFKLRNFTKELSPEEYLIVEPDVNRLALQLTGFFEHFQETRVQLIGRVEYTYLMNQEKEQRLKIYEELFKRKLPCIIFSRKLVPEPEMVELAQVAGIPILGTNQPTGAFMAELIYYLKLELAPCIAIHGVLVDVYGVGVLITGESGIGKSEAALELVRRGHRLVADDVVEIRKINEHTLSGSAPDITRHLLELRGIGIIDVKMLFGAESVKAKQNIDLVLKLSEWNQKEEFDRLGLHEEYVEFLGNKVVCQSLPIRPGRNVAVIAEVAAVNHRQKKMGYNAAKELYHRMQANIEKTMKGEE
ncbi:Hpr(Ser) kinase/phosphatase [Lachnospiraceae bacterium XBB1006]|nr:Hpr(Ser) kinase/phosphatase [Lachnospiraceae bacterium XBB1006]